VRFARKYFGYTKVLYRLKPVVSLRKTSGFLTQNQWFPYAKPVVSFCKTSGFPQLNQWFLLSKPIRFVYSAISLTIEMSSYCFVHKRENALFNFVFHQNA